MKQKTNINPVPVIIEANPTFEKPFPENEPYLEIAEFFHSTIQGEGINTGKPATFLRVQHCSQNCVFCFGENTQILMSDFSTKNVQDVKVGDEVMGINRRGVRLHTRLEPTKVVNIMNREAETIKINNKTVVTPNHKFLYNKYRHLWQQVKSLHLKNVKSIECEPFENEDEYWKGWLSGLIDGDGCFFNFKSNNNKFYLRFKIGLNEEEVIDLVQEKLEYFGFEGIQRRKDKKLSIIEMTRVPQTTKLKEFVSYKTMRENVSKDFKRGYLAGFFDAEGYQDKGEIRISQKQIDILKMVQDFAIELGFETQIREEKRVNVIRILDVVNFFALCRPRLKKYKPISTMTLKRYKQITIDDEEKTSNIVYNLTTECGSYVADGSIVSNCDTASVWRYGNPYTFNEIFELLEQHKVIDLLKKGQHLVLTGGSPVKQQDKLISLFQEFKRRYGFLPHIEIENECNIMPKPELVEMVDTWNNSPKLENSMNPKPLRYVPSVLKYISGLPNSWFKFVIDGNSWEAARKDWKEIREDFLNKGLIKKEQIIIMPLGESQEELNKTREIAALLAIEKNVRFTDRLHITIWNQKVSV